MASDSEVTLVLPDASLQDKLVASLEAMQLGPIAWHLEPDDAIPGQELALDLYASNDLALAELDAAVRNMLRRDFSLTQVQTLDEASIQVHGY